MSKTYSFKTVQLLKTDLHTAWDFFSRPENLQQITPANLGFKIISAHTSPFAYAGQIIEYKVSPLLGITIYWMTEITHVVPQKYFVDEQRYGPYSLWHHQHHFVQTPDGVEMTDIVHYKLPFWFLGDIANSLFVKRQLQQIFEYRRQQVSSLFGA